MYSFVLQDWITIRGTDTTSFIQTEKDWLDMSPYQDVVAWLDVRSETSNGPTTYNVLYLETAPAPDDSLFQPMNAIGANMQAQPTPTVIQYLMGSATVPVAQFVRWRIVGAPTAGKWDVTFRILLAANAPGLHPPDTSAMSAGDLLLPPEL